MNKQLAHISYDRSKEWDHLKWVQKLSDEFNKAWWDFRDAVTDKDYNKEFDKQLQECREKEGFRNNIALNRR